MITLVRQFVIPAAYSVLPAYMASDEATRMLLAIGWQESRFRHRVQIGGPARGLWQFEMGGGVIGVLGHSQTRTLVRDALQALNYRDEPTPFACYQAIQHNDVLACVFARLLLWTIPDPLPISEAAGWHQYVQAWRPGKPHEATWSEAWLTAVT